MTTPEPTLAQQDMAYHQARVLLLVDAVSKLPGHARKLDGAVATLRKRAPGQWVPPVAGRRTAGEAQAGPATP